MGGLPGLLSTIGMAITSLNPDGFAQKLREIKDTILLIKDAITGAQEIKNIAQQTELLDIALNNIYAGNDQVLSFYESEKQYIKEINEARARGDVEEAATLSVKLDRYNSILNNLVSTSAHYEKLNKLIYDMAAGANITDSRLEEIIKDADDVYLRLEAISKINNKTQAKTYLKALDNIGLDGSSVLYQDVLGLTKGNFQKAKQTAIEGIRQTIAEMKAEINKGFANGGNETLVNKIIGDFKEGKNITPVLNEISVLYANIKQQGGDAATAADAFVDSLIEMANAKDGCKELAKALEQMKKELEGASNIKID